MNDKISLINVRLINWYGFIDEEIPISPSMTMIYGDNGSGKSTILDAIKYAFDGDTEFNHSAAGSRGSEKRTLVSYTRGLINRATGEYMRPASEYPNVYTHIALEYEDEADETYFTLGMIIETSSSNECQTFCYEIDGKRLDSLELMHDSKIPFEHQEFRSRYKVKLMAKEEGIRHFTMRLGLRFDNYGLKEFRRKIRNMSAYRPDMNIEDFIKTSVLREENVDFHSLREKKKSIDDLTSRLEVLNQRTQVLKDILDKYHSYDLAIVRLHINEVKKTYRDLKICENNIVQQTREKEEQEQLNREYSERLEKLRGEAEELEMRLQKAKEQLREVDGAEALEEEKRLLRECNVRADLLKKELERLAAVQESLKYLKKELEACGEKVELEEPLLHLTEDRYRTAEKQAAMNRFRVEMEEEAHHAAAEQGRIDAKRTEIEDQLEDCDRRISDAQKNLPDYSHAQTQLSFIREVNRVFEQKGMTERACFVSDYVVSITDESWHDAIEAYLGPHRYAVIVPVSGWQVADEIHDRKAFRYTELVNSFLLDKEQMELCESPVSDFLEVKNELAKKYFQFFLGRIRAVPKEKVSHYRSAMSKEGKLSRNMGVTWLNPKRIGSYCLGKDAAEKNLQLAKKEKAELTEKKEELLRELSGCQKIEKLTNGFLLHFQEPNYSAGSDFSQVVRQQRDHEKRISELEESLRNNTEFITLNRQVTELDKASQQCGKEISDTETERIRSQVRIEAAEKKLNDLHRTMPQKQERYQASVSEYPEEARQAREEYDHFLQGEARWKGRNTDVASEEAERRIQSDIRNAHGALTAAQASYNVMVEAEAQIPFDPENEGKYEGDYRSTLNRLRMDDIEDVTRQLGEERGEYERIFKNEFAITIYRNCRDAIYSTDEINRSLRLLKFSTSYRFDIHLVSEDPGDMSDYAKILRYAEYLDKYSSSTDQQMSFGENGIDDVFEADSLEMKALEKDVERIIDRITRGEGSEQIEKYADYREYMNYDIRFSDAEIQNGSLKRQIGLDSGAWRQIPFTIILTAALSLMYGNERRTVRLFFIDEPFEKMSQVNVKLMIDFFRQKNFQVIFCAADKLNSIGSCCDIVIPVMKFSRDNMRVGEIQFHELSAGTPDIH
ncbi:MAG: SbcC/MukB-like Walker B domain-containing protein [Eubacteriales bacterium]|jgi:DNA repair exonuclease SbcCD ATPase subunit